MNAHPCVGRTAPDAVCRMLRPALRYAARGWPVFPCRTDKRPATAHGFKDATADRQTIVNWWIANPAGMIGVPTGSVSGFVVIDLDRDVEKGLDGIAAWSALIDQHGAPVGTRTHRTPRGGMHLLFRHPGAAFKSTTSSLAPGIDTRGDGGYVVMPPSSNGSADYCIETEIEPGQMPVWLIALLRERDIMPEPIVAKSKPKRNTKDSAIQDLAKIEDALGHLSADCTFDDWLRVGMALHSWNPGLGRALWDSWSRTAPERYKQGAVYQHWFSFVDKPGGITIASLFKQAMDNGWIPKVVTAQAISTQNNATAAGSSLMIPLPSNITPIVESAKVIFPLLAERRAAFWRGGRVCELIKDGGQTGIEPVRPEAFRSRIEALGTVGTWIKTDGDKTAFSPKRATKEDCVALLATLDAAKILPPIESVFAAPVLIEDAGAVHRLGRGYHMTGGGCLVTGGAPVPLVVSAEDAAVILKALLVDFQFATPGDFSRALAFLITPCLVFGRFLRGPCPIFVAEADQSQTGKGFLCKTICKLYGEEASIVAQRTGGVGGFDESVQERMVSGRPFIFIDNLRGHVDSKFIESTLTASGRIGCRIPHHGEIHVDTRRFLFLATSNGIKSTTDFANRACIIRLRKHPRAYSWHEWPEGGLWEHVEVKAALYQSAVHSIIEAWHKSGASRAAGMEHDFRDWAGVAAAIISMTWPEVAPLLEGHREAQERTANPALSWLREVALAVSEDGRCGEEYSATAVAELCAERGIEIPGLRDGTDAEKAAKLVGYTMRRCLGDGGTVTIEGHTVQLVEVMIDRNDGRGRFAAKRYLFTSPEASSPSKASKAPITPETYGDSLESYNPLLGLTGEPQFIDEENQVGLEGGTENAVP